VESQYYQQWAKFHAVDPNEGGRHPEACEFRVTARICLLDRALKRLDRAEEWLNETPKEDKGLDTMFMELIKTKRLPNLKNNTGGHEQSSLIKWIKHEKGNVQEALDEQVLDNKTIYMQPLVDYKTLHMHRLLEYRDEEDEEDREDEKEGIQEVRDKLTLNPVHLDDSNISNMKKVLGITSGNSEYPMLFPIEMESSPKTSTMMVHHHGSDSRIMKTLNDTRALWNQTKQHVPYVYHDHIEAILRNVELIAIHHPDQVPALEASLVKEIQPFCHVFLK
jgi:hypothetical protein